MMIRLFLLLAAAVLLNSCAHTGSYVGVEKWYASAGYGYRYELHDGKITVTSLSDFNRPSRTVFECELTDSQFAALADSGRLAAPPEAFGTTLSPHGIEGGMLYRFRRVPGSLANGDRYELYNLELPEVVAFMEKLDSYLPPEFQTEYALLTLKKTDDARNYLELTQRP